MLNFMKLVSSYRQNYYTRSTNITNRLISSIRYADPKFEFIFKRLDENADLLLDFLNKILPEKKIKSLIYQPSNSDPEAIVNKQSMIDILCFDQKGSKYFVGIQNTKEKGREKCAQYYVAKAYSDQMKKGGKLADFVEIIYIGITDFIMFPEKESFISTHKYSDSKTGDNDLRSFLSFIIIELPKDFQVIEEWCELLKDANKRSTPHLSSDIMNKAYRSLEVSGSSETELSAGREDQVREEGRIVGRMEEKIRIAVIMLEEVGRPVSYISSVVGLSEDELSKLKYEES